MQLCASLKEKKIYIYIDEKKKKIVLRRNICSCANNNVKTINFSIFCRQTLYSKLMSVK